MQYREDFRLLRREALPTCPHVFPEYPTNG